MNMQIYRIKNWICVDYFWAYIKSKVQETVGPTKENYHLKLQSSMGEDISMLQTDISRQQFVLNEIKNCQFSHQRGILSLVLPRTFTRSSVNFGPIVVKATRHRAVI